MSTDEFMNRFLDGKSVSDPMRVAQRSMRKDLPKRFYKDVEVAQRDGAFALTLDGKLAKTPGRNSLAMPSIALAEAMADEWRAQTEIIDPTIMPLTRLANVALDRVSVTMEAVRDDMAKYGAGDLICYRADTPARLVEREQALWNPVLEWAAQSQNANGLGASFNVTTSVLHVQQPDEALIAIAVRVSRVSDPFRLTALHMVTTLTGSVLLALALDAGAFDASQMWDAAHVDEDVQIEIWGEDDDALERRAKRRRDYDAAILVIRNTLGL